MNIKVDREERPDLDAVYMNAVVGMTGQGGWPMTMFLTPAGEPFHGGTYYPPEPRYGMPSFRQVLSAVDDAWRERRGEVMQAGAALATGLRRAAEVAPSTEPLTAELLTGAMPALRSAFDPEWGGFGGAPKFPAASTVGLLLRLHVRTGSADALRMATETLDGMALGGMHDLIGGGFHRYAVDRIWLVPHFEKMLYDNALLASAYLEGFAVTGERRYATGRRGHARLPGARDAAARGRLRLVPGRRHRRRGGLDLRLDAGPARRGAGRGPRAAAAAAYYGVTDAGNFEGGATVLRAQGEPPPDLAEIRAALLERRSRRPQPGPRRQGAGVVERPRAGRARAGRMAAAAARPAGRGARLRPLPARPDDRRRRAPAPHLPARQRPDPGLPGRLRRGLPRAARAGPRDRRARVAAARAPARRRGGREVRRRASNGGFYQSASDAEQLVARHKELDDNPTPSGNALLAQSLIRLGRIYAEPELERLAAATMRLAVDAMRRAPHGLGQMLAALDLHLSQPREVAVVGPAADPATRALADAVRDGFHPDVVYAFGDGADAGGIPLLEGRGPVDGAPAAYICERFACRAPLTDPAAARAAMAA